MGHQDLRDEALYESARRDEGLSRQARGLGMPRRRAPAPAGGPTGADAPPRGSGARKGRRGMPKTLACLESHSSRLADSYSASSRRS